VQAALESVRTHLDEESPKNKTYIHTYRCEEQAALEAVRAHLDDELRKDMQKLREENDAKISEEAVKLREECDSEMDDLRRSSEEELEKLRAKIAEEHEAEVLKMKEQAKEAVVKLEEDAQVALERMKQQLDLENQLEAEKTRASILEQREKALREARDEESKRVAEEKEEIIKQLRASLKAEIDKAMSEVVAEHERNRAHAVSEQAAELEKALNDAAKEHQETLAGKISLAKQEHERELREKIEEEIAGLKNKVKSDAQQRLAEARANHEMRVEEELDVIMAEWREENKERMMERIAQEKDKHSSADAPGLSELREVFESSAARHVCYTMQLVRDWASLEGDGRLQDLYEECAAEQHTALQGVRELYVSQLQRIAEALLTRMPPPPDELVDIVERAMKAVVTAHRHTRVGDGGNEKVQRLLHLDNIDAAQWIRECARDELESQQAHFGSKRTSDAHNNTNNNNKYSSANGGSPNGNNNRLYTSIVSYQRALNEDDDQNDQNDITGMIRALRNTPDSSLALAVAAVRRQMANEMGEVLGEDYTGSDTASNLPHSLQNFDQVSQHTRVLSPPPGGVWDASKKKSVRHMMHLGYDDAEYGEENGKMNAALALQQHLALLNNKADTRHSLTERFRHLEPSPAVSRGGMAAPSTRSLSPNSSLEVRPDIRSSLTNFVTPRHPYASYDSLDRQSEPRLQVCLHSESRIMFVLCV
jgi:hypothetical protein